MNKIYKAVLLTAIGVAGVASVHATTYGDLIAGFTTQSGNDQIVDLANISTLYNGETWFASTLGISAGSVGSYSWGVVGNASVADSVPGTSTTYDTILSTTAVTPPPTANGSTFNDVNTGIGSIIQNFNTYPSGGPNPGDTLSIPASYDDSWSQGTINGALPTQLVNSYGNPNVTGATSDILWEVTDNESAPVELGSFTLGPDGTLTYAATAVPEPSTYGLVACGLAAFSIRRLFFRKAA